jgi:hypothetical protein
MNNISEFHTTRSIRASRFQKILVRQQRPSGGV